MLDDACYFLRLPHFLDLAVMTMLFLAAAMVAVKFLRM